jgi:prophage maintenance system killer protein
MYNISKKDEFHAKRDFALIKKLTSTIGHEVFINTMWLLPELKVRIQDEVEQGMQQIFDEFHEEIASAVDKIPVIAKCIQHIDQLHPFVDGNIRTCYVLLNKLLSDYGLPLTILLNPNKLDACSLDEVIQMIRDGQVIYQQLINNTDPNQFVVKTNEKILELQSIICPPNDLNLQKLLGAFYRSFIHREQGSGLSKATAQRFFSSNKDFSCALRNACNKRELGIITELLGSNKTIDVNQQSSNGNTALDWFDKSGVAVEHDLFKEVREILVAKGALNNKFVPSMPVSPK